MIYIYSLIHLIFIVVATLLWRLVDRKPDYKKYWVISIVIGLVVTLGFDFAGSILFNLWDYYSVNVLEYAILSLCTYVAVVPLLIEVIRFLIQKFMSVRLFYGIRSSRMLAFVMFVLGASLAIVLGINRISKPDTTADWQFLLGMFVATLLLSDGALGFAGDRGIITLFMRGYVLVPFVVIVSGIMCGFVWELLNEIAPLWYYHNLPEANILGIPLAVIILWGTLNLGYYTLAELVFDKLKLNP